MIPSTVIVRCTSYTIRNKIHNIETKGWGTQKFYIGFTIKNRQNKYINAVLTCFNQPTTFLMPLDTSVDSGSVDAPVSTISPHLERSAA